MDKMKKNRTQKMLMQEEDAEQESEVDDQKDSVPYGVTVEQERRGQANFITIRKQGL